MPARIPWVFRDLTTTVTPEEYLWEVNPREFDITYQKSVTFETTTAPDGRSLVYEGMDEVRQVSFTGVILREDQYDQMIYWFTKRHQLQVEDDLGRLFSMYITSFKPRRVRSNNWPWKHQYTCQASILDWAD